MKEEMGKRLGDMGEREWVGESERGDEREGDASGRERRNKNMK